MSFSSPKIGFGKHENFLVLAASWLFFGALFQSLRPPLWIFLAWALLSAALAIVSLDAIGYFGRHTPEPELSGVLSLLLVLPFSALLAKWVLVLIVHIPPIRYLQAMRASVWVALLFEASQWVIFKVHLALGRKWSLAAYLFPDDLNILKKEVERSNSSWWINIRPASAIERDGEASRGREALVISRASARDLKNHPEFVTAHLRGSPIIDFSQLIKEFRGRVDLHSSDAWTFLLGSNYQSTLIRFYFHLKTFLEPIAALLLLALLAPLLVVLASVLYLSSGGPVFYRQERLGYRGRSFPLFKFRTMSNAAEIFGAQWAGKDDPRVTPIGRWLRKTRLDELPQLLNVLQGELSFVGPRPERPEFYKVLNDQIPLFNLRLLVRPGITGWAQVNQGYAASIEECKTKLEYDLYYIQNMSPRLDFRVIIDTLAMLIRGNSGR